MAKATTAQTKIDRTWFAAILLALVGLFFFLRPFLGVIAFAILVAYLVNPVFQYFYKGKEKRKTLAVVMATIVSFVAVLIPLTIFMIVLVSQATDLVDKLGIDEVQVADESLTSSLLIITEEVNQQVENLVGVQEAISEDDVTNFVTDTLPQVFKALADLVLGIVKSIPSFFTSLIIYLFVFTGLLAGQEKILSIVRDISPFDKKTNAMYLKRIGSMATAMFKGQLLIAFLQGLAGAISLALVGLQDYFLVFVFLFSIMNLIPLGSGIITIPIGIGLLVFGQFWPALIVLGTHFLLVTNIDNVLRPMLIPEDAKLPASLTILSAFAGVAYFGLLGVIYGPVIMIIITSTIESYIAYKKQRPATA